MMLQVNKDVLAVIKDWSKSINTNRSKKLSIINFFFILGKFKGIKARIKEGHFITNVNNTIEVGLQNYMTFLHPIVSTAEKEKRLFSVVDNSVCTIYQLLSELDPTTKRTKFYCVLFQKVTIKNIYAFLEDIFKGLLGLENYKSDPSNLDDYRKLFYFKELKEHPVQYIVIKTEIKTSNTESTISWHLLGQDKDSLNNVYYSVAQEFQILPIPVELGQIEKILP